MRSIVTGLGLCHILTDVMRLHACSRQLQESGFEVCEVVMHVPGSKHSLEQRSDRQSFS